MRLQQEAAAAAVAQRRRDRASPRLLVLTLFMFMFTVDRSVRIPVLRFRSAGTVRDIRVAETPSKMRPASPGTRGNPRGVEVADRAQTRS